MSPKCVLVIDDEEDIREVTTITLELEGGWRVLTASSGEEGIQLAQKEMPDAILLDVMMPNMDGIETAKALQTHQQTRSIPIMLLTAKGASEYAEISREVEIVAAISKPFDPLELVPDIERILNWS